MPPSIDPADLPSGAFVDHLGVRFLESSGEQMVATWEVRPELHQPWGILHGGVHCSVIETLASVGGQLWLAEQGHEESTVVGVNNNTDFLRAAKDGTMRSVATPVHRGRSQQLWLVETRDDQDRLVARGHVRLANLHPTT